MEPSFHIVTSGHFSKEGNFIARDYYGNSIHVSKSVMERVGFLESKAENIEYPVYVLANIKEYNTLKGNQGQSNRIKLTDDNGNYVKFKRLTAQAIFNKFSRLIGTYEESIDLNLKCKISDDSIYIISELNCIKGIFDEYENYVISEIFEKENKSTSNIRELHDLFSNKILLLFEGFKFHNLTKHLDRNKYQLLKLNSEDFGQYYQDRFNMGHKYNDENSLYINILPLYPSFEFRTNQKTPMVKIITFDKFNLFDKNLSLSKYIDQFYELNDNFQDSESYIKKYKTEGYNGFISRCQNEFNCHSLYTIKPVFIENIDRNELATWHNHIIKLCDQLLNTNVSNLIIYPPYNDIEYHVVMEDDFNNRDYGGDFNEWVDLSQEEMRNMDEEDPSWRISNDLE